MNETVREIRINITPKRDGESNEWKQTTYKEKVLVKHEKGNLIAVHATERNSNNSRYTRTVYFTGKNINDLWDIISNDENFTIISKNNNKATIEFKSGIKYTFIIDTLKPQNNVKKSRTLKITRNIECIEVRKAITEEKQYLKENNLPITDGRIGIELYSGYGYASASCGWYSDDISIYSTIKEAELAIFNYKNIYKDIED